jgi:hypothetical protein
MEEYFYSIAAETTYSGYQMLSLFGIDPETTSLEILNFRGFYPVQPSTPNFDLRLYDWASVWNIVPITGGEGAQLSWTPVPKPLPEAQANGSSELKVAANSELDSIVATSGVNTDILTATASEDPLARPVRFQDVLDVMVAVTDSLDANLTAIDSATTVDEINDIVNPPTGVLFTGRGSGLGPQDLNVSYYTAWNSVSLPESDSELYVPGTSTVIAYGSGGAGKFDSFGNCFAPGNYLLQIRQASTGRVIAEIEVPLSPAGENVAF